MAEMQEMLDKLSGAFNPQKAAGINAVIQLRIKDMPDQADWMLIIKDQQMKVEQGKTDDARLSIYANSQDLVDIFTGKLDGVSAYMMGKIWVTGDLDFGMRLASLFGS
jgi:putative sterol carrier protein